MTYRSAKSLPASLALRLALATGLAVILAVALPQHSASAQAPEVRMGTSFDCSRTGPNIPSLVCQTPELQLADLSQMQVYYTLRHAQPERQQELRNQFTTRIQALVRECSTEQVRASGTQSACVAHALVELRTFWLQQLERLGNAAALEEARLPPGHFIGSQQALKARNFLPAEAVLDGVFGSGGRQAISQFQAERGIPSTGFLTAATAESLRSQPNATASLPRANPPPVAQTQAVQAPLAPPARSPAATDGATQEELAAAQRALNVRDYATALRIYRPLAERGVPAAQGGMARLYGNGWGVERNDAEVLRWARLGAAQSDPAASIILGVMFRDGRGVAQNHRESSRFFEIAANQGNSFAQLHLGIAYNRGLGKDQNFSEAFRLFNSSSASGNSWAQAELGDLYVLGNGVRRDFNEALRLFRLSSDQNDPRGTAYLGTMFLLGLGVNRDVAEGVRLYRRSADQGNSFGQAALGSLYLEGTGVEKNYTEALRLGRMSALQNDCYGQALLGTMYLLGFGVQKNISEAIRFGHLSAQQNCSDGQALLGVIYLEGDGLNQNYNEALRYFRLSASQNNATGQVMLGFMFSEGSGVRRDDQEAIRLFRLAVELNNSLGQFLLASMYYSGSGVTKNFPEAIRLLRLSAAQNLWQAQNLLGVMLANGEGTNRDLGEALRLLELASREGGAEVRENLQRVRAEQERANQRARQSAWDMQQQQQREEAARRETEIRISIDRIVAPYRGRQKSLLEQIFNYSSFASEDGLFNPSLGIRSYSFWISGLNGTNKCVMTRHSFRYASQPPYYTQESMVVDIREFNRAGFRISRGDGNNGRFEYGDERITFSGEAQSNNAVMERLQNAWGLAFQECPGRRSAF